MASSRVEGAANAAAAGAKVVKTTFENERRPAIEI
jgi:hypothetical protein